MRRSTPKRSEQLADAWRIEYRNVIHGELCVIGEGLRHWRTYYDAIAEERSSTSAFSLDTRASVLRRPVGSTTGRSSPLWLLLRFIYCLLEPDAELH